MTRQDHETAARALVVDHYPDAIQAWLAGSTTTGRATATSDLDVTVLLDDAGAEVHRESLTYAGPEQTAVAVSVWRSAAELALAVAGSWTGAGKWLVRELAALDERVGSRVTAELDDALRRALAGDAEPLVVTADAVLDRCGGRHWSGLYRAADLP